MNPCLECKVRLGSEQGKEMGIPTSDANFTANLMLLRYFWWDLRFQSSAHTQMNMLSTWATKHGMAGSSFPRICKRVPSKHFLFPTRRTFHVDLEPTNTKHWDPISQSTWTSNLLNSFVCKVDPSVFFCHLKEMICVVMCHIHIGMFTGPRLYPTYCNWLNELVDGTVVLRDMQHVCLSNVYIDTYTSYTQAYINANNTNNANNANNCNANNASNANNANYTCAYTYIYIEAPIYIIYI